jgi:hypothetical protein
MTSRPGAICAFLSVVLAVACDHGTTVTGPEELIRVEEGVQFAKGQPGGSKGGSTQSTVYAYWLSGDIMSIGDAPTASKKTTAPFTNLSLTDFSVTLVKPTGTTSECQTGGGEYATNFGANAGPVWTGSLKIAKTETLSFLGTNDSGETIQFSVADASGGATQEHDEGTGSYTYSYTDARLFFGSNSTHHDGKYRCVNLVLVAMP